MRIEPVEWIAVTTKKAAHAFSHTHTDQMTIIYSIIKQSAFTKYSVLLVFLTKSELDNGSACFCVKIGRS